MTELRPALAGKAAFAALLCLVVAIAAEAMRHALRPARPPAMLAIEAVPASAVAPAAAPLPQLELLSTSKIPMPDGVPSAHASTLVALGGAELLAIWWAGSRESAADVAIYASRWVEGGANSVARTSAGASAVAGAGAGAGGGASVGRGAAGAWSAARQIVERNDLAAQLGFGVRRLGNPVAWVAPDGRLHLYAVATGPGGWAAARIAHITSSDRGQTFKAQRVLPLSPLFNISVLVRSHPVALDEGGWLLPAYFELGHKMPMLIAMDAQGTPLWSRRIGEQTASLQPALLPISATQLRAVMRDHGPQRRIRQALSSDAGRSWSDASALDTLNEDTAIGALRLAQGGYAMAHNDRLADSVTARQWLRLSTSADAMTWHAALDVERGAPGDEYSYPSLLQIGDHLHLSYTFQRKAIAHRVYQIGATAQVK